tara:strand:- start:132 stop:419 length:288 start_codon:yes stop_codon:yes gene_type:complete
MTGRELILEIYREADFVTEMTLSRCSLEVAEEMIEFQSAMNIKRACSAFLNGEDVNPHTNKFVRKELELNACEELEIWGKFSPPDQIISYDEEAK